MSMTVPKESWYLAAVSTSLLFICLCLLIIVQGPILWIHISAENF
jgi:hypothetical protein